MTIPVNLQQNTTPWGAEAQQICFGPQGGPVTVVDTPTPLPVSQQGNVTLNRATIGADTAGGWSAFNVIWPTNVAGQTIKVTQGELAAWSLQNNDTVTSWCNFYDLASTPTIGVSTPLFQLLIPAQAGNNLAINPGVQFNNGLGVIVHGGAASDTTSVNAGMVTVNVAFK